LQRRTMTKNEDEIYIRQTNKNVKVL